MFILGLYLGKTAVIYSSALNRTTTNGKAPPRVLRILHLWTCPWISKSDPWSHKISRLVNAVGIESMIQSIPW